MLPKVGGKVVQAILFAFGIWDILVTIYSFQAEISLPQISIKLYWIIFSAQILAIIISIPYIRLHYIKKDFRTEARIENTKKQNNCLVLYAKRSINVNTYQVVAILQKINESDSADTIGIGVVKSTTHNRAIRVDVVMQLDKNAQIWNDLGLNKKSALENTMISEAVPYDAVKGVQL